MKMSKKSKELNALFDFLKKAGFENAGSIFFKKVALGFILCEFQYSKLFNGSYMNFGVFYHLGMELPRTPPKSPEWHFVSRYDRILQNRNIDSDWIIDLNANPDQCTALIHEIKTYMENYIIPELLKLANVSFMKENFPNNFNHNTWWLQNIKESDVVAFLDKI